MQKLLFLDVDGVLNSQHTLQKGIPVCPDKLSLLRAIINVTNCEIVLSSTWRMFPETREELKVEFHNAQIPIWIGLTPQLNTPRNQEIKSWLKDNEQKESRIVIIDDDDDAEIVERNTLFVQTSFDEGLTMHHVQTIIDFFQGT